ncbi:MAG TPA: LptF/LptG family permease, partial [Chromatiales bacterium]|nr:LptF/LptG family permease [Chromatiales bacterium]HEX21869.1 LptF/LptG family permease [Chromatiales bacterium]
IYRRSGTDSEKRDAVIVAESGFQYVDERSKDRFLVLEKGTRYEGRPGDFEWTVMDFEKYALRIKEQPPVRITLAAKALPTAELLGRGSRKERAELHWRFSKPFVVPILVLLALSFCYVAPRRSQLPRMMAALGLYFAYNNMLGYGHALLRKGKINPELGLWGVHALFALLAIYLFWRRVRGRPVLPRLFHRRAAT